MITTLKYWIVVWVFFISSCKPSAQNSPPNLNTVVFIPTDSANKMIESYLSSIDNIQNQLHSLIMDVDSLRLYFADTSIHKVKLMFAHTFNYINKGNYGINAAYQYDALTIVMGGVNSNGDYVMYNNVLVPNEAIPCPKNCWLEGTASSNVFPISTFSFLIK